MKNKTLLLADQFFRIYNSFWMQSSDEQSNMSFCVKAVLKTHTSQRICSDGGDHLNSTGLEYNLS